MLATPAYSKPTSVSMSAYKPYFKNWTTSKKKEGVRDSANCSFASINLVLGCLGNQVVG